MIVTTKAQRAAIKRVYDRAPIYLDPNDVELHIGPCDYRETYRSFRRRCFASSDGSLMVRWKGMWLGIERDGYTHS